MDAADWMLADYQDDIRCEGAEYCRDAVNPRRAQPISTPPAETRQAERLSIALRGALAALGVDAAGLYALDDATTQLNLQVACGLDSSRLEEPPRILADAIADLEALCGHAVVLEDDSLHEHWNVPEPCGAAVCVPVSTHANILGTLWLFCDEPRTFSDVETNLIEIVAARIAYDWDLERALNVPTTRDDSRNSASAVRLVRSQIPTIAPDVDGFDLAGWTGGRDRLATSFHDWIVRSNGQVVVLVAAVTDGADDDTMAASLVCQSVRSALRAHARGLGFCWGFLVLG